MDSMNRNVPLIAGIVLLASAGLVPITTTCITLILPETFASTTRLVPAVTEPAAIATQLEIIRSNAILLPVITNLNLARTFGEKFKEEEISVNDVYYILSRSTDIKLAKGTHLIEITAFSDDNAEAAAI